MPAPKELDPSASLAALYGTKLRKLRTRAGWTQRELGDRIPIAHSRIAQFELGNETPPEDVNRKLDALLGADGDLVDLWIHARRTPFPDWVQTFVTYEAKAIKMLKYMAHAVPGLLQTEAYARALLRISRPRDTDAQIEGLVAARRERQAILGGGAPPLLWCILDESVIRRPVGGRPGMRKQLAHLLHMARTPHVVLQVLPFSQGEHPVMGGSLTLLSFDRGPDVAYTESSHSGELLEAPEEVAEYALAYDLLQAKALPPDESLVVIRSVMEEYS
ncbi:Scr1 family TA system antitoxin-like transcriptional regulator [Streptomyces sp. NPDC090052]|uniref:helix-turn-helix domain-containing protein n=1 Tax=unclassified Streptomyces TaxID=2593676 RepID=UPI00382E1D65|nr:helix-turn-helix transcriptional regulator [Streptomyces sp. NBC_00963]WSX69484.1 helix-turn-helix transcriptional regulator [Streptomyces sp. NBC_00932]